MKDKETLISPPACYVKGCFDEMKAYLKTAAEKKEIFLAFCDKHIDEAKNIAHKYDKKIVGSYRQFLDEEKSLRIDMEVELRAIGEKPI